MTNDKNSDAAAPLRGIRVLDLTCLLPGPVATMHLADMGAEIIKIEDTDAGDYARTMGPVRNVVSQFFVAVNRGKHTERMNLKDPVQRERLLRMVENADVLVESFRPGVMDRLGLGWEVLSLRNPKLVMCAISGYGKDGLFAQLAGHDINYIACAGMLEQNAGPDGRPVLPDVQIGELLGGAQTALQGMLAALVAVKMGSAGRFVDISITDAVLAHNIMPLVAVNNGSEAGGEGGNVAQPGRDLLTGGVPCYNVYRTRDQRYMAVGALELKFWQLCCDVLQRPDLKTRHWQLGQRVGGADSRAVQVELDGIFAQQTMLEWSVRFAASDCCVCPVLRMEEALQHPLFQSRNMVAQEEHPSEGRFWTVAHPIRFSL
jgi:alpha-methylacyl-CoA racemase